MKGRQLVTVNVDSEKMKHITPEDVTRLDIGPDDIVVLSVDGRITDEMAIRLKERFSEAFGLSNRIAVVERSSITVSVEKPK